MIEGGCFCGAVRYRIEGALGSHWWECASVRRGVSRSRFRGSRTERVAVAGVRLFDGRALAGADVAGEIVPAHAARLAFHADPLAGGLAVGLAPALVGYGAGIADFLDRLAGRVAVVVIVAIESVGFEANGEFRVSG